MKNELVSLLCCREKHVGVERINSHLLPRVAWPWAFQLSGFQWSCTQWVLVTKWCLRTFQIHPVWANPSPSQSLRPQTKDTILMSAGPTALSAQAFLAMDRSSSRTMSFLQERMRYVRLPPGMTCFSFPPWAKQMHLYHMNISSLLPRQNDLVITQQ